MRRILLAIPLLVFAAVSARADDTKDFLKPENWEGLMEYWKIDNGTIVGQAPEEGVPFNTFLCSKKKYANFKLSCQVRLEGGKGNSGIQIRSKIHDEKKFAVTGPQCDMGQQFWGCLYGENFGGMMKAADFNEVKKVLKADDFNDYAIECIGKHVKITINGLTTVDADFEKLPEDGIIALQMHAGHPKMQVTFKNIKFEEVK